MPRQPKRYVLLLADRDLDEPEFEALGRTLEGRMGKVKLISVKGNPRAVIVRTTNSSDHLLRDAAEPLFVGGTELRPTLTSGVVGKLKRRASRGSHDGQVPK